MENKKRIIVKVDLNTLWQCCNCGWIGKHSESADKTPVIEDLYWLVCPKCGNKDEFTLYKKDETK